MRSGIVLSAQQHKWDAGVATTSNHQIVEDIRSTMLVKLWACCVAGHIPDRCAGFWFSPVEVEEMTPLRRRCCDPAPRLRPRNPEQSVWLPLWAPQAKITQSKLQ